MSTPEQIEKYISGWKKRKSKKNTNLEKKQKDALEKASCIADMLKDRYGIKKVILFGSTATGKLWEHSDIDIAVFGLDENMYLDVVWEASQLALPFSLDIVPLEKTSKLLQQKIQQEGMEL